MHPVTYYDDSGAAQTVQVYDTPAEQFFAENPNSPGGTSYFDQNTEMFVWIPFANPLEHALEGFAENSGFQVQTVANLVRGFNTKYGYNFSDQWLANAVPVFGNEHRAAFNSGYTNASNYSLIALRVITDSMKASGWTANYPRDFINAEYPQIAAGANAAAQRWVKDQQPDRDVLGDLVRGAIVSIASSVLGPTAWVAFGDIFSGVASAVETQAAEFLAEQMASIAGQAAADQAAQQAAAAIAEQVAQAAAEQAVAAQAAAQEAAQTAAQEATRQAAEFSAERAAEASAQQAAQASAAQAASDAARQVAQQAASTAADVARTSDRAIQQQIADKIARAFDGFGNNYEQAVAQSSLQNAIFAEVSGAVPAGTVLASVGAEATITATANAAAAGLITEAQAAAISAGVTLSAAVSAGVSTAATTGLTTAEIAKVVATGAGLIGRMIGGTTPTTTAPFVPRIVPRTGSPIPNEALPITLVHTPIDGILGNITPMLHQLFVPVAIVGVAYLASRN